VNFYLFLLLKNDCFYYSMFLIINIHFVIGDYIMNFRSDPIGSATIAVPLNAIPAEATSGLYVAFHTIQTICSKMRDIAVAIFNHITKVVSSVDVKFIVLHVNSAGTQLERIFNVMECLPFICVVTSWVRGFGGQIQLAVGVGVAGIGELGKMSIGKDKPLYAKFELLTVLGREQVIHGGLNVLRGMGAGVLATCTMGIGNVVLIVPEAMQGFAPRVEYGILTDKAIETKKV